MSRPTRATVDGRAYLDLQNLARRLRRPTDELQQFYALEGILARLSKSPYCNGALVLKGGVLLAAYDMRRATRDLDFQARQLPNDVSAALSVVRDIASLPHADGLVFDTDAARAETIREGDLYSGVRVHLTAGLAGARLPLHVDVSVGDPIAPPPQPLSLPRLIGDEVIQIIGYPLAMVHAEKLVTAIERGTTNTRWRDFADVFTLAGHHDISGADLTTAIVAVSNFRKIELLRLADVLDGFARVAQRRWAVWQRSQSRALPNDLSEVLDRVMCFADPAVSKDVAEAVWSAQRLMWLTPDRERND
jgi:hypothetical protein